MTARHSEADGGTHDRGSAVVEFIVLVVLITLPIAYLVLAAMRVQAGAYAVATAAREAARAYATADTPARGLAAAESAVALALADQGFAPGPQALTVTCGSGRCLAPGSTVRVVVDLRVRLPFLPGSLGEATVGSVPVRAEHITPVDTYRGAR